MRNFDTMKKKMATKYVMMFGNVLILPIFNCGNFPFSLAVQLFSRDERHVVIIGDKKFQADAGQDAGLGSHQKGGGEAKKQSQIKAQKGFPTKNVIISWW